MEKVLLSSPAMVFFFMLPLTSAQSVFDDSTTITGISLNTTYPAYSTTTDPEALCASKMTCGECVGVTGAKCYFCYNSTDAGFCRLYPAEHVFPRSEDCALSKARWGVCWVNFEALIITMSVLAGVFLIAIVTGIYCCCCRRSSSGMVDGGSIKWERETREREQRHADRRAEREVKKNSIRQKYGLNQETSSYNRMS